MRDHGQYRIQILAILIIVGRKIKLMIKELKPNTPFLTVDCVLFDCSSVILIRRGSEPFKGWYALPGGHVEVGETTEQACVREVKEEVGIEIDHDSLQIVGVYSDPGRDPNRHTVSVAYIAEYNGQTLKAGDDADSVKIIKNWQSKNLAFDHAKILEDAWVLKRKKN